MTRKISMDGALMRIKLARQLVNQIARMQTTDEADGVDLDNDLAMDGIIRRARQINATAAERARNSGEGILMAQEFAFDVKLFAVVRVIAPDEATARKALNEEMQCVDIGTEFSGGPGVTIKLTEASCDGEHDLIEIDGEAISKWELEQ